MKCPKCKKEIDYLNNYQSGENHHSLLIIDGEHTYEEQEFQPNGQTNDFECSECKEILFTDEDKAIEFLEGDTNK